MSRQFRWFLLIFWVVAGAGQAADVTSSRPLYSLEPGVRWSYAETQKSAQIVGDKTNVINSSGTVSEEILQAPAQYRENSGIVLLRSTFNEQREAEGAMKPASGGYVQLMEWHQGDLYLHGIRVWVDGAYSEDMNPYQPPLLYLKGGARTDESWTVGTQKIMGIKMPTMATVDGTETITVPAGVYSNCLKVTYVTWRMSGVTETPGGKLFVRDGNVRDTVWIAKDVGVVKEIQVKTTVYQTGQGSVVNHDEQTKVLKSHISAK